MIKKGEIITILAVLLFVYITDSAKAEINDVEITPDGPTTEDIITVVTFGTEGSGSVTVIDTVVNIIDSDIGLDLTLVVGPYAVITPWSYSQEIGTLPAGTYDLTVRTIVSSVVTDTYFKTFQVVPEHAMTLDGSGTQEDPWRIRSLDDFNEFAADPNYWAGFTRLETDVNLAGLTYTTAVIAPDTNNSNLDFEGTAFTGVFDGNNHKIINLSIDDGGAGNSYLGLFGQTYDGEVKDLSLEGGSVSGDSRVGCLVGFNCHGSLSNCYSTGSVSGGFGYGSVGGLVGWNNGGSITDCYSTGSVSGVISGGCGGLVGWNNGGSISDCFSTGDVIGPGDVGGLVGINGGSILNCYSTGDVSGNTYVGGLVGFNASTIRYCYSTGSVSGEYYFGGLVGVNEFGSLSNCFWDTDTQIHGVIESIGDNNGTVINVAGLPTAQMQTRSTFTDAGWDFINVWNIGENQTYPYLRAYLAGDINKDGIVNLLDFAITANKWLEGVE